LKWWLCSELSKTVFRTRTARVDHPPVVARTGLVISLKKDKPVISYNPESKFAALRRPEAAATNFRAADAAPARRKYRPGNL
jgi:hypothetical protein